MVFKWANPSCNKLSLVYCSSVEHFIWHFTLLSSVCQGFFSHLCFSRNLSHFCHWDFCMSAGMCCLYRQWWWSFHVDLEIDCLHFKFRINFHCLNIPVQISSVPNQLCHQFCVWLGCLFQCPALLSLSVTAMSSVPSLHGPPQLLLGHQLGFFLEETWTNALDFHRVTRMRSW